MWIKGFILTALLVSSVKCKRVKQKEHQDYVDKQIMIETLNDVEIQCKRLTVQRLEKYDLDAKKFGILLDNLEELGQVSVKLVLTFIDSNSSSCLQVIGNVAVIKDDCKISEEEIKFFASYRGNLANIDELTKLIQSLQFVEDNLVVFKTQLLGHRQSTFHGYIENIKSQQKVAESILASGSKYYTSTELKLYVENVNETLNSLETKINDLGTSSAQQQQSVEHEKEKLTESVSGVTNSNANATAQFVCEAEIKGDTNALKKYLDLDDVADLRKLLDQLLEDVVHRLSTATMDGNTRKEIDDILKRIEKNAVFLKEVIEAHHTKQKNLLNSLDDALKNNNVGKQKEILKQITSQEDAKKAIMEVYKEKNNLDDALAACDRFDNFESLVAGLLALNNTKGVHLPKSFEDLVYDKMEARLKMYFTGDEKTGYVFCCHSASIVNAVYKVHKKTGINILIRLQKGLDASDFYVGESKWLNHVIIFLYNNLKIILKNECEPNLYEPIKNKHYLKYFRRVLAYIEILRILEPNDLKLFEMTGNLQKLITGYWKDVAHLETLEVCKEYKNKNKQM